MKKVICFYIVLLSCTFYTLNAQKKSIQFHSINSAGISMGQNNNAMLFQTVNGFSFNNFFTGIGFGIDFYEYRSLPLFFDLRKYFGNMKKVFAYGDAGYNFNAGNKPGNDIYYTSYHFTGGAYTDVGIGYKTLLHKKTFFTISAGYNYKGIFNKVGVSNECYTAQACPIDYSKYHYKNNKVVLKAGIDF